MPSNMYQIIHPQYNLLKQSGDLGIEIEVELKSIINKISPPPWRLKGDGSLRGNGYEFVTNGAILSKEKDKCIDEICTLINSLNPYYNCPRTSVHVHCNIQDLTVIQTWTYLTAYFLLENLLFKFCSSEREGNTFCLRLMETDNTLDLFVRDLAGIIPFSTFRADKFKYLGGSPYPITRFGSFEWRGLEGGKYEPNVIKIWTDVVLFLKESSKKFASPSLLLDRYFHIGGAILPELLPLDFVNGITVGYKGWQSLLKENACLIGYLAYSADWIRYEDFIERETKREKKKPDISEMLQAAPIRHDGNLRIEIENAENFIDNIDF